MRTRPFPITLVVLIIAIAAVNGLAQVYSWYWTVRWLDMPMHFAGGVWLAGVAVWWRYYKAATEAVSFMQILVTALVTALGIGLLWEVFEAYLSFSATGHINAMPDTLKDLLFDTIGGTTVAVLIWWRNKQK